MSDYLKGEFDLLYLVIDGVDIPIGCSTSHGFNETSDMLDTTTTDNGGWKTSRPTNQSYTIDFEGLSVISNEAVIDRYSYDLLVGLKRNRTLIDWKEVFDQGNKYREQTGKGYIVDISELSPVGEYLTFNATIEGYGEPVLQSFFVDSVDNLIWENGDNAIAENGDNIIVAD